MLSVVIETKNDEDPLARTLSSLVAAAVEGAVREVIVCDLGSTDRTHHVADHAGCVFLTEGGIAAGVRRAKSEWLLVMEPGARLLDGWAEHVADHTARLTMAARFSRARAARAPFLSRVFSHRRALADGLVITKRQATSLARNAYDAEGLARGLAMKRLAAQIMVAQPR
jgi:glycosyltransferase involved in cell wall biosynthesis